MAVPSILLVASGAGIVAGAVAPTAQGDSSVSIIVGGVVAIVVALIGGAVQIYVIRRRHRRDEDSDDPELTLKARVQILETHQADIRRDVAQILEHVRPWGQVTPPSERRKR